MKVLNLNECLQITNSARFMQSTAPHPQEIKDEGALRLRVDRFLAGVEKRSLAMALVATRDKDEALDLVQDAMLAWVTRYTGHGEDSWKPLYYKVLQSRILDWHRRTTVRRKVMTWFGQGRQDRPVDEDLMAAIADPVDRDPSGHLHRQRSLERMLATVQALPLRQQQAFLLRSWEGMDVGATATAMGCSEGSVKTHLSRAMATLREAMGDWI